MVEDTVQHVEKLGHADREFKATFRADASRGRWSRHPPRSLDELPTPDIRQPACLT
ncbi:hypothetical protein AB7M16_002250 [Bradyrhizobium sp. USDA 372]